jgi:hypothetical protein
MGLDTKTYCLTDRQSQCDFDFDFELIRVIWSSSVSVQMFNWQTENSPLKTATECSSCEDLVWFEDFTCATVQWYWECVI